MCPLLNAMRPATACGEPARDVEPVPKLLNDNSLNINTLAERRADFPGGRWLGDHGVTRCPAFPRQNNLAIDNGKRHVLGYCAGGCDRRATINVLGHLP
jgi:hypothetical protein